MTTLENRYNFLKFLNEKSRTRKELHEQFAFANDIFISKLINDKYINEIPTQSYLICEIADKGALFISQYERDEEQDKLNKDNIKIAKSSRNAAIIAAILAAIGIIISIIFGTIGIKNSSNNQSNQNIYNSKDK